MSYFVQMAALTVQNFASAAAGIAVAIALVRGFARQEQKTIGNFWVDLTRATVYILLPISLVARAVPVLAGRDPELNPYTAVTTVEGATQIIAQGPGGVAGSDQAAGHQRRRILQRKLLASVRESDAADQLLSDVPDLRDPGGLDLHVRQDGRRHAAGLGDLRGIGVMFLVGVFVCLRLRAGRQPDARATRRPDGGDRRAARRKHGRQGGPLRRSPTRRCLPP